MTRDCFPIKKRCTPICSCGSRCCAQNSILTLCAFDTAGMWLIIKHLWINDTWLSDWSNCDLLQHKSVNIKERLLLAEFREGSWGQHSDQGERSVAKLAEFRFSASRGLSFTSLKRLRSCALFPMVYQKIYQFLHLFMWFRNGMKVMLCVNKAWFRFIMS